MDRTEMRDTTAEFRRDISAMKTELALLKSAIKGVEEDVENLVTRPEFTPVKIIVYGMVGSILTSVLVALLSKVIVQ